jgi:hypothetical protein
MNGSMSLTGVSAATGSKVALMYIIPEIFCAVGIVDIVATSHMASEIAY